MSSLFYYEPFYNFDRLVDEVFSSGPQSQSVQKRAGQELEGAVKTLKPRMDLHEDKDQNTVTATFEFPGVSKENIQIHLQNGRLTVSAETRRSEEHSEGGYIVRERREGKYSRTLQLPQGVTEQEVKASMDHGVLTITFPMATPELAPKRIELS